MKSKSIYVSVLVLMLSSCLSKPKSAGKKASDTGSSTINIQNPEPDSTSGSTDNNYITINNNISVERGELQTVCEDEFPQISCPSTPTCPSIPSCPAVSVIDDNQFCPPRGWVRPPANLNCPPPATEANLCTANWVRISSLQSLCINGVYNPTTHTCTQQTQTPQPPAQPPQAGARFNLDTLISESGYSMGDVAKLKRETAVLEGDCKNLGLPDNTYHFNSSKDFLIFFQPSINNDTDDLNIFLSYFGSDAANTKQYMKLLRATAYFKSAGCNDQDNQTSYNPWTVSEYARLNYLNKTFNDISGNTQSAQFYWSLVSTSSLTAPAAHTLKFNSFAYYNGGPTAAPYYNKVRSLSLAYELLDWKFKNPGQNSFSNGLVNCSATNGIYSIIENKQNSSSNCRHPMDHFVIDKISEDASSTSFINKNDFSGENKIISFFLTYLTFKDEGASIPNAILPPMNSKMHVTKLVINDFFYPTSGTNPIYTRLDPSSVINTINTMPEGNFADPNYYGPLLQFVPKNLFKPVL